MAQQAVKVIKWSKLIDKVTSPYRRKMDALFKAFDAEASRKPLTLKQRNDLWNRRHQKRYETLERKEDEAYKKVYYRYHNPNNTVKDGYKIIIGK